MSPDTKKAEEIAKKELRSCYTSDGIIAGTHHFTDYWARDGYFAALGSLTINDHKVVKNMLGTFYKYQRSDGLIPYRIMRGPVSVGKYFGKPDFYDTPRPTYKLRGFGQEIYDGTTLTVLFTALLAEKKEVNLTKFTSNIKKALKYLEQKEKNDLLWDGVMAEWNDSALKWGNLLYSNIIYWYMYDRLTTWAKKHSKKWFLKLNFKTGQVKNSLYKRLWNGKYFADWYDFQRQDYLYPYGNCLAIAWGLTSKKESELILKECGKVKIAFTLENNSPKYSWWRIDPIQNLAGMGDYQNHSILWWQPIISYLAALKKSGKRKLAREVEKKIIKKILDDKTIYECYERNGKPVSRFIYKSEHPFAWASGMLLWAFKS